MWLLPLLWLICGVGLVITGAAGQIYVLTVAVPLARSLNLVRGVGWRRATLVVERELRTFQDARATDEVGHVLAVLTVFSRLFMALAISFVVLLAATMLTR